MIDQLDDWVLRRACRDLRSLHLAGHERLRVAVNCCASNLGRASLVDEVRHALEQAGLAACFLELEVTEDALMYNIDQTIPLLERLRELGVSLSIDDFGTGYSSLAHRRLPLDALKVDRSFIMDIPASQRDMEIAQAIIAMAQKLHLKVVAEAWRPRSNWRSCGRTIASWYRATCSAGHPLAALEEFLRAYRFDAAAAAAQPEPGLRFTRRRSGIAPPGSPDRVRDSPGCRADASTARPTHSSGWPRLLADSFTAVSRS